MTVRIDGDGLTASDVVLVARGAEQVVLAEASRERLIRTRTHIETHWMHDDAPLMYAFNTGVGMFKDRRVAVADMGEYQTRLIKAHATGVGEPLDREAVRATMLLRANAFAADYSGPGVAVVDRLLDFLNLGLHPVIPRKGSVGASGDLAPLAYLAGALCGFDEAEIEFAGTRRGAREAIAAAGLSPDFPLGAKDASALLNGSTVSLAIAVLAAHDARQVVRHADIALALTLEALRGELAAFEPPIHQARPHPGQRVTASNVLRLAGDSRRCSEAARQVVFPEENRAVGQAPPPRVQDVYSVRCAPQVHGPVRDALGYIDGVLGIEINSATDNPLIFPDEDYRVISGGNFHGPSLAHAERSLRSEPSNTVAAPSLRGGAEIGPAGDRADRPRVDQRAAAGAVDRADDEQRAAAQPQRRRAGCEHRVRERAVRDVRAGDGEPHAVSTRLGRLGAGKGNAEDHVSNSTWCARKARTVVDNVTQIVAGEVLLAAQALSLVEPLVSGYPLGSGTRAAFDAVRAVIEPALAGDRWFHTELAAALDLVRSGALIAAVEAAVSSLE